MTKKDVYDCIMNTVCNLCEVNPDDILKGVKKSECVEARCIISHYLLFYGVLPRDIIRFSDGKVKHRYCITKSASLFHDKYRYSFSFRCDANTIGNILKEILQQSEN